MTEQAELSTHFRIGQQYNPLYDAVLSIDVGGMIEYWDPREPFEKPDSVEWTSKAQTGLYEFKKVRFLPPFISLGSSLPLLHLQTKSTPVSLSLSPTYDSFAILSLPDLRLTTFSFTTGRLLRAYDESLTAVQEMQQAGTAGVTLDSMELGRRLAVEKELEKASLEAVKEGIQGTTASVGNPTWDETGKFVIYPTVLGIKGAFPPLSSLSCSSS